MSGFMMRSLVLLLLCSPLNAFSQEREPIRVGFIVPLTGPLSEFGAAIRNGVTLAREENAESALVFESFYEDSKYESVTALSALAKMRTVDHIDVAYVFGGPMSDSLAPVAEQMALPMFSTEYDIRYTAGKTYVIRFANNAADYAKALLTVLRARGLKRFALVKVENQYHNTLSQAFLDNIGAGESAKLLFNFQPDERDFRSAIARLRSEDFDALGVYLVPGMQQGFIRQLRAANLKAPLFGTDTFESVEENRGIEDAVEGALYSNSAVGAEFRGRYMQRFHNDSQIVHAALAYEFARLLTDLFEHDIAPNPALAFLDRFKGVYLRPSACGRFLYRNSARTGQYFSFPIAVREVERGGNKSVSIFPNPEQ